MPKNEVDLFQRYAMLVSQKEIVEAELETLKDHVIGFLMGAEIQKKETKFGTFAICERAVYSFPSADVLALEAQLKERKEKAKADGMAKTTTSSFLKFTKIKE